jgi:hypothetical protein
MRVFVEDNKGEEGRVAGLFVRRERCSLNRCGHSPSSTLTWTGRDCDYTTWALRSVYTSSESRVCDRKFEVLHSSLSCCTLWNRIQCSDHFWVRRGWIAVLTRVESCSGHGWYMIQYRVSSARVILLTPLRGRSIS